MRLPHSIGWAGIGLKRAAVALSHKLVVKTRYEYQEQGAIIEIDIDEWLSDEEKDTYSIEWVDDIEGHDDFHIDKGTTTLELRKLKFDFKEQMNPDEGEDGGTQPLDEFLANTYDLYLSDKLPEARDVTVNLSINGDPLKPDEEIPFSWTPIDGLYPRTYPNLLVKPEAGRYEGDVLMDVTVGLLREGDAKKSGITLYANGRKILSHRTDKEAGFGISGGLNEFNPSRGHKRLIIRADMRSLESAEDLPFNTSKTGINPDDYMAQEAYKKIKNAAKAYFDATFERIPAPVVYPYPPGSPYAGNNGKIKRYDYEQGRTRINGSHKPGKKGGRVFQYPEAQELKDRVSLHAKLGIEHVEAVSEEQRPAYLGIHLPPDHVKESGKESHKDGRLQKWVSVDEGRIDHWFYSDELDYINDEDSIEGQLEKHFSEYYEDQYPGLTIVSEGPEDTFNYSDLKELAQKVADAVQDLERLAKTSAENRRILEEGVLAEWKYPKYLSQLRDKHGKDLNDLESVDSKEKLVPTNADDEVTSQVDSASDGSEAHVTDTDGEEASSISGPSSITGTTNRDISQTEETSIDGKRLSIGQKDDETESQSPLDTDDETDSDLSLREFCQQNLDLLDEVDEDALDDDLDQLIELIRAQLEDGLTFRRIRHGETPTEVES